MPFNFSSSFFFFFSCRLPPLYSHYFFEFFSNLLCVYFLTSCVIFRWLYWLLWSQVFLVWTTLSPSDVHIWLYPRYLDLDCCWTPHIYQINRWYKHIFSKFAHFISFPYLSASITSHLYTKTKNNKKKKSSYIFQNLILSKAR